MRPVGRYARARTRRPVVEAAVTPPEVEEFMAFYDATSATVWRLLLSLSDDHDAAERAMRECYLELWSEKFPVSTSSAAALPRLLARVQDGLSLQSAERAPDGVGELAALRRHQARPRRHVAV